MKVVCIKNAAKVHQKCTRHEPEMHQAFDQIQVLSVKRTTYSFYKSVQNVSIWHSKCKLSLYILSETWFTIFSSKLSPHCVGKMCQILLHIAKGTFSTGLAYGRVSYRLVKHNISLYLLLAWVTQLTHISLAVSKPNVNSFWWIHLNRFKCQSKV